MASMNYFNSSSNLYFEVDKLQTSKSIDGCLKYFFQKKLYVKKQYENV
jgi:hypothetical protein